ncbi:two-component system sensor histidine kinase NtrB [Alteribacter natronophilus]|uniref:two-component system sensor histidine kinase NtrB n=1 Tax=Alteribacter natronophilus TaxID=2583810 RepID=UPI00110F2CD7|nr:ATP-binding protein [Alteribacter natronophilus]TMW73411.1 PAS domain-containing protein [Alteribacter natronophilus]
MEKYKSRNISILEKHLDLGTLINSLPIGVLIVDAEGNFCFINEHVYRAWGADPASNTSASVHESYTGWWRDTGERVEDNDWAVVRALTSGESSFGEVIDILRFDGQKGAILNSAVPVKDHEGRIIGAIVTISDITHIRKLEQELELHKNYLHDLVEIKTQELTEKNERLNREIVQKEHYQKKVRQLDQLHLVGEMAAGFAHEIRNPLTTVKGYLQLMSGKNDLDEYKGSVNLMIEEIEKADQIITRFIKLARDKTNSPEPFYIKDLKDEILAELNSTAALKNQKIVTRFNRDLPRILADRSETVEMILHLAQNGLEAMEESKVLTIRATEQNGRTVLEIIDQGSGISEEVREKAATPFFSTKDENTGLGMSIAYSIAGRNNASIDVRTGPEGTTVSITFDTLIE